MRNSSPYNSNFLLLNNAFSSFEKYFKQATATKVVTPGFMMYDVISQQLWWRHSIPKRTYGPTFSCLLRISFLEGSKKLTAIGILPRLVISWDRLNPLQLLYNLSGCTLEKKMKFMHSHQAKGTELYLYLYTVQNFDTLENDLIALLSIYKKRKHLDVKTCWTYK